MHPVPDIAAISSAITHLRTRTQPIQPIRTFVVCSRQICICAVLYVPYTPSPCAYMHGYVSIALAEPMLRNFARNFTAHPKHTRECHPFVCVLRHDASLNLKAEHALHIINQGTPCAHRTKKPRKSVNIFMECLAARQGKVNIAPAFHVFCNTEIV